jgi:hypothetical protein
MLLGRLLPRNLLDKVADQKSEESGLFLNSSSTPSGLFGSCKLVWHFGDFGDNKVRGQASDSVA